MINGFTIDLEDWFCSHNLLGAIRYEDWDKLPGRVVEPTMRILELLSKAQCKATFFVLGWIADRYPELIKMIAAEGHEIASHGYSHRLVTNMNSASFKADLQKSVAAIHHACGIQPKGFRAPAFTVVKSTLWALDELVEQGFLYDSSIYPTGVHPDYGIGDAPLNIFNPLKELIEIPLSCASVFGRNIPCSGGAYLRFLPYPVYKKLVDKVISSGRSYIFYIHPWEIDAEMPRVKLSGLKHIRHYTNLSSTFSKMERLLRDFEFTSLENVLSKHHSMVLKNGPGKQHG
ncbi:XrtA system polysaccharide deacetylase [Pedobacter gandavensis]|uniref:XrtA system polysaccharide deacetylase n=1 Tax=Pedobacter gandavensis TaxID=2679963 RepID=UPI00292FE2CF|nr:XrtA system polysaccharide deacetylase [Pedobacter gandavensis]